MGPLGPLEIPLKVPFSGDASLIDLLAPASQGSRVQGAKTAWEDAEFDSVGFLPF